MNETSTARSCRRRLNQIEHWLRRNPERFGPTHLVVLRSIMEDAESKPSHVRAVEGLMLDWMLLTSTSGEASEGPVETPKNSETGGYLVVEKTQLT